MPFFHLIIHFGCCSKHWPITCLSFWWVHSIPFFDVPYIICQSFTDEQSSSFVVSMQQWVTLHIWPPPHLVSIAPSTVWGMRGLPFLGVSLYLVLVVLKKGVEECLLLREIKLLTKMARSMNSKESSPNSFKILGIHPHLCPEIDLNQY